MEPFYVSNDITIYRPETTIQAYRYGRGTQWCTATRDPEDRQFDRYNSKGPLYIVIPKRPNIPTSSHDLLMYGWGR